MTESARAVAPSSMRTQTIVASVALAVVVAAFVGVVMVYLKP